MAAASSCRQRVRADKADVVARASILVPSVLRMFGKLLNKALKALLQVAERLGGPDFAQKLLRVLVICTPYWRRGPFLVARLCTKRRWFATATQIGEIGLRRDSVSAGLRLVVADSYLAGRQFDAALHHAQQLIAAAPDSFDGFHIASESLQQLGSTEQAIQLLEQGLDRCVAMGATAGQGRSRHVQRHLQAYQKREWLPLYSLWRAAVLAPNTMQDLKPQAGELCFRPQAIQYWSQGVPPDDVQALTARWNQLLQGLGLPQVQVFSQQAARAWIAAHQPDFLVAFDSAPHYAAESDVFRLAYAMGGDTFWIDSDLLPAAQASAVLALALRQDASLLFLKRKVPYLQSSAFVARAGCPYFQAMADPLRGFDYSDPQLAGISRLHLIHDCSFGPATYAKALEKVCCDQGPAQACHEHLPLLQQIQFPTFCLSLFSGERLVIGAGKDLAYKRSSNNWKVWARS